MLCRKLFRFCSDATNALSIGRKSSNPRARLTTTQSTINIEQPIGPTESTLNVFTPTDSTNDETQTVSSRHPHVRKADLGNFHHYTQRVTCHIQFN